LLLASTGICGPPLFAAELDDLYSPLLKSKTFLYEGAFDYFTLKEDGRHGGATYDKFYSTPSFYSFTNSLRCLILPFVDVTLCFKEYPGASYKRTTYNPAGTINSVQKYTLESMQDYTLSVRMRKDPAEFYLDMTERREKSSWNWHINPGDPPNYFSYIEVEYRDIVCGLRYLSDGGSAHDTSSLSTVTRPLMEGRQLSVESEWEYRNGALKRNSPYYGYGIYYNYYQKLKQHLASRVTVRYGVTDAAEVTSGISYTFPLEYEYDYITYYASNSTSLVTSGTYVLDNNFSLPIAVRLRPAGNCEALLSSDLHFVHQSLDAVRKNRNNTQSLYSPRSLDYFNIEPAAKISCFYDAGKDITPDDFTSLTKRLLMSRQCLMEFHYRRDITLLRKNADNGPLNLIDPYDLFTYPVDYFLAGSEYSTFFVENNSAYAASVKAQNYDLFGVNVVYGLTDMINVGFGCGYRSGSAFHHLSLPDLQTRVYKIKGYCYLDPSADVRLTKNSMLSFKMHYVPQYITFMQHSGYPREFKSKTAYMNVSAALKALF